MLNTPQGVEMVHRISGVDDSDDQGITFCKSLETLVLSAIPNL